MLLQIRTEREFMKDMIKITGVDLVKFVQKAYELSQPQGIGFLHAEPGGLSEDDAKAIISREKPGDRIAASMDYVKGRACKMVVFREGDDLFIRPQWYDHSVLRLKELLSEFGIALPEQEDSPTGWGTMA